MHHIAAAVTLGAVALYGRVYLWPGQDYRQGKSRKIDSCVGFDAAFLYLFIACPVVTLASLFHASPLLLPLYPVSNGPLAAGTVIAVLACALFLSARMSLGSSYSPCSDSYLALRIVDRGPYRFVRHPLYLANILLLLAFFVMSGSLINLVNSAILSVYSFVAARNEERALNEGFPEYGDYRRRTGMLLPKLSRRAARC